MQLALILPAALFMTSVLAASDPRDDDLARFAQQIVMWYSGRMWTLWLRLLALPVGVLTAGSAALQRRWNGDVEVPLTNLTTTPVTLLSLGVLKQHITGVMRGL